MVKNILNNIEKYICAICFIIMLAILSYQVVARFFGVSNSWSEELARYLFIWTIFVGASYAAQQHSHIVIETMMYVWPKKARRVVGIIGTLVWIAFACVIVYYSGQYTLMLYNAKRISLSLYINMAYPYAAIPIGYAFLVIRLIQCELIPRVMNKTKEQTLEEQILASAASDLQAAAKNKEVE